MYQRFSYSLTTTSNLPLKPLGLCHSFFPRSMLIFVHVNFLFFMWLTFIFSMFTFLCISHKYQSASSYHAQKELSMYFNDRHMAFVKLCVILICKLHFVDAYTTTTLVFTQTKEQQMARSTFPDSEFLGVNHTQ